MSEFIDKFNCFRFINVLICCGMIFVNEFLVNMSVLSIVRFVIFMGMVFEMVL